MGMGALFDIDQVKAGMRQAAGQWDADLIVIGTHGRRGFERMVMGSAAENLVRLATTSLFLVRRKAA